MAFVSKNPFTGEEYQSFDFLSPQSLNEKLEAAAGLYQSWRKRSVRDRCERMLGVAEQLREREEELAQILTDEMGKPIGQSRAEVQKCAWLVEHFCSLAGEYLRGEIQDHGDVKAGIRRDPVGVVLGIMPWNYPYWQVFRYAVPAILAGNICVLKHAPNVPRAALKVEELIKEAVGEEVLVNLFVDVEAIPAILSHSWVRGACLTGSVAAGSSLASVAGEKIIPTVLELGSNDPFIILKDAPIEEACETFMDARFTNTGQTCIAAKRLIVEKDVAAQVREIMTDKIANLKLGNPNDESNDLSCMAREDLAETLEEQWNVSAAKAGKVHIEARREGTKFYPGFLEDPNMASPAWRDELFGPVATMKVADGLDDCINLANDTQFGLGCSLWTSSLATAEQCIPQLDYGTVSVNQKVSSDPRWPFGGYKKSGYGRELGREGIYQFTNLKTFWLPKAID
jgi:succinate-semialdehyde dehydrogenase/glutarate-semialdehyde dehydrogenase